MKRRIAMEWLLVTVLVCMLVIWLAQRPGVQMLGQMIYDRVLQEVEVKDQRQVVVIEIDNKSLDEIGAWPWSNNIHAQLLENLSELKARSVLFQFPLTHSDSEASVDERFIAAMRALPVYLVQPVTADGEPDERPPESFIAAASGLGHVHVKPDLDGIVRRINTWEEADGTRLPYAGLLMASAEAARSVATQVLSERQRPFGFPAQTVGGAPIVLSYWQVMKGNTSPDLLRGRDVWVGWSADAGVGARWPTDSARHAGPLSELQLHANAVDVLREGRAIRMGEGWAVALWGLVPVVIGMVVFLRRERHAALAAVGLAILCVAISAALLFWGRWWLSPVAPVLGLLFGYVLWSWRRQALLFKQFQRRLRYLDSAAPDDGGGPPLVPRKLRTAADYISALDGAVDRLSVLQNVFRQSLRELPVAVLLCGRDGTIRHANPAARAILNLHRDGAGRSARSTPSLPQLLSKLRPTAPAMPDAHWATVHQGAVYSRCDYVFRVRCVPLRGRTRGWAVVLDDLSAEHRIQAERAQWLRFLSHDLRSPQANILSHISIDELQHPEAPGRAELAEAVRREVYRTLSMAEGFMDLSQAETGDFSQPVLVTAAVSEAADQVWAYAQSRQVRVALRQFNDELYLRGHATLFTRALVNLLNNAIRHSRAGTSVQFCVGVEADQLSILIQDEGEGMSPELVERLLGEPSDRGRIQAPVGSAPAQGAAPAKPLRISSPLRSRGIGLAVVWAVVQQHGGVIDLWSAPGAGSSFLLTLPLMRLTGAAQHEEESPQD